MRIVFLFTIKFNIMNFFQKNWVFISGLISAIVVAIQQFTTGEPADLKVVGFAALMAVLSYVANQWRGKGVTVTGIIGVLAATFSTIQLGQHIEWTQLILQAVVAIGMAVAPPPKPEGYEQTPTIENAKAQGKEISDSK
jgi:hypothetical protein